MVRTAAQYTRIAAIYEGAARNPALPMQPRAAFGKKASWFRMLAQLEAIKTGAASAVAKRSQKNPKLPMLAGSPAERSICTTVVTKPIGFLTQDMLSKKWLIVGVRRRSAQP